MDRHEYIDAPLWTVIETLGHLGGAEIPMARLAHAVRTRSGYPGAYRAIGRAIAAGYVDYRSPNGLSAARGRLLVKLSDRGCRRLAAGRSWPRDAVGAWKVAAARSTPGRPALVMPGRW